jgi:hypothetical protein
VLENHGTVVWSGGNIDLNNSPAGGSGRIENTATGLFEIQLAGGLLFASGHADVNVVPLPSFTNAGTVRKTGSSSSTSLSVPFTTVGIVELRTGTLNATGLVTITPESAFRFVIGGPSPSGDFGQFKANGPLTLDGEVEFALTNGFAPADEHQFTIVSAGTLMGNFATVQGNALPNDNEVFLNPMYTGQEVIVRTQGVRPILETSVGAPGSQFRISGIVGQQYRIYATSDLAIQNWILLDTVTMPGITFIDIVDPEAGVSPHRFYQAAFVSENP